MSKYFSYLSGKIQQYAVSDTPGRHNSFRKFKKSFFIPLAIVVIVVVGLAVFAMRNNSGEPASVVLGSGDQRVEVQKPKATQTINRSFEFPLNDSDGKEVSKLKYEILNAELRNELIVKGKRATAVKGRTFLILNLKITNSYNRTIQINTRDYIRVTVNNSAEKLAPEIHNDPVEIQADSTKYTRVGLPINDTDKNITVSVGEISGPKQTIKLTLNQ